MAHKLVAIALAIKLFALPRTKIAGRLSTLSILETIPGPHVNLIFHAPNIACPCLGKSHPARPKPVAIVVAEQVLQLWQMKVS